MGRRAQYLSLAERQAAEHARKACYADSLQYSIYFPSGMMLLIRFLEVE